MGSKTKSALRPMKQENVKEGQGVNRRSTDGSWHRSSHEVGSSLPSNRAVAMRVDGPLPTDPHTMGIDQWDRLASVGESIERIAHDLRNPLGSIELLATLLGKELRDGKERRMLSRHLVRSVRSLEQRLSNLLVWTKPLRPHLKNVPVQSLTIHLEQAACLSIQDHHVTIQWQIEPDAEWVRVDEGLVQHVLLNLILNAMQASSEGDIIQISCHRERESSDARRSLEKGSFIVFRIEDHGCGISPANCAHVFRPFFSCRKGGTGLGLSIVDHIMKIHGGTVTLTSQERKGTTVELCFPQNRRSISCR